MNLTELINDIETNKSDIETVKVVVVNRNDNTIYYYNKDSGYFYYGDDNEFGYLTDAYTEAELIKLKFKYVNEDTTSSNNKSKEKVRHSIEDLYMELEMELDACQGCTDNLDEKFEMLNVYKDVIEYLGGDTERDYKEILDRWYSYKNKEHTQEENEKEYKKHRFDDIKLTQDNMIQVIQNPILNEIVHKLNTLLQDRRND